MPAEESHGRILIDPALEVDPDLRASIRRTMKHLQRPMSRHNEPVTVVWSWTKGRDGAPLVHFDLKNSEDHVEGVFSPEELHDHYKSWGQALNLWGDLLQSRSSRQLNRLDSMIQELKQTDPTDPGAA